jgi:hypothetical protein
MEFGGREPGGEVAVPVEEEVAEGQREAAF